MKKKGIIAAIIVCLAAGGICGWMFYNSKLDKMRTAGLETMHAMAVIDDYREAQQEEINRIFEESEEKILESRDQDTIDQINKETADKIAEVKTDAELCIEEGIESLEQSVSLEDYRDEQQKEVKAILQGAKKEIENAVGQKEIDSILEKTREEISQIKTNEQLSAEEEAARQAAARARAASSKKQSSNNNSEGCVGNDASNFY